MDPNPSQAASKELVTVLLGSGEASLGHGEPGLARKCAESARDLAIAVGDDPGLGRALVLLSRSALALGERGVATSALDAAIPLVSASDDAQRAAAALCHLAEVARGCGDPERARGLLLESLRRSSGLTPGAERARALEELGMLDRAAARFEDALQRFLESHRIFEGIEDRASQGRSLNKIGNLLQKMGRPAEAREYLGRALRIWEDLGNHLEIGKASNNIGSALLDQGDYDAAARCFERARALFHDLGERAMLAHVLNNLGLLNDYKGEMREAERLLNESLEIRAELGDRSGESRCLNNLSHVALSAGRYEAAADYAQRSIAMREDMNQHEGLAKPWVNLAQAYIEMGRYEDGERAAARVRDLAERSGSLETSVESQILDGWLALRRGSHERAVEIGERASEIAGRDGYRQQHGQAQHLLGDARLAMDGFDAAREHLLAAESIFRDLRAPLLLASCRLSLGRLFHRIGSAEAAAERFRRAVDAFERMGNPIAHWGALLGLAEAEWELSPDQSLASLDAAKGIAAGLGRADLEERTAQVRRALEERADPSRSAGRVAGLLVALADRLREGISPQAGLDGFVRTLMEGLGLRFVLLATAEGIESTRGQIPRSVRELADRAPEDWELARGDAHEGVIVFILRGRDDALNGILVAGRPERRGEAEEPILHAASSLAGFWLDAAGGRGEVRSPSAPRRPARSRYEGIVGASPPMLEVYATIEKVAPTDASILIQGESGTGKELVARAIHNRSRRSAAPFVAISCPSIPRELIEAELFGHERGAFTGAHTTRPGRIEAADRGTLFLDEIGDMAQATQSKLLRFLQERELQRVGGRAPLRVDVRLVAATSRDLDTEIREGRFREDLLYRIKVVPLRLPPLRERIDDLPLLLEHFLHMMATKQGRAVPAVSEGALTILSTYPWPGNIRELQNTTEYLIAMGVGGRIEAAHIPERIREEARKAKAAQPAQEGVGGARHILRSGETLDARLLSLEGELIRDALERCGGNQTQAAKMLGITETRMRHRMRRYGVPGRQDAMPAGDRRRRRNNRRSKRSNPGSPP